MKSQCRQKHLLIADWNSHVLGKHISLCCVLLRWRKAAEKKRNNTKTKQKQLAEVLGLVENVFTLLTS